MSDTTYPAHVSALLTETREHPEDAAIRNILADALEDAGDADTASWHRRVADLIARRGVLRHDDAMRICRDLCGGYDGLDDEDYLDLARATGEEGLEGLVECFLASSRGYTFRHYFRDGEMRTGRIWYVEWTGDGEPEESFHDSGNLPCGGEWVGDHQYGYLVIADAEPECEDGWRVVSTRHWLNESRLETLAERIIHADGAGRTLLQHIDAEGWAVVRLEY